MAFLGKAVEKALKKAEKAAKTLKNPQEMRGTTYKAHNEIKRNEVHMKKQDLKMQADEILRLAAESGLQSNYFFVTTFERYQTQLEILDSLRQTINDEGLMVTKEYVRGRKNLYESPAIQSFNRTTDSANKTVATLLRIIKSFEAESSHEETDPLMDIINGGDIDDGK